MRTVRRWLKRQQSIEDLLRTHRPEPPKRLLHAILADVRTAQPRRAALPHGARLAALSAAVLVGLLAVGGVGYAGSIVGDWVVKVTSFATFSGHKHPRRVLNNAAHAQYGTTTTATTTTATTTTATTTTATTTTATTTTATTTTATTTTATTATTTAPTTTGETATTSASSDSTGTVNVTSPNVTASIDWSPGTFSGAVTVSADAKPTVEKTLVGQGAQVVSVTVTGANGPVHTLDKPLEILFKNPPAGFVPSISDDGGQTFQAIPEISGPPLPTGDQYGWYSDSAGTHVLTLHLSIFAVLSKQDLDRSSSGRKFSEPGSGKFGDPLLVHSGTPDLKIVKAPKAYEGHVSFVFFVDEQVAAYFSVKSGGMNRVIRSKQSTLRGNRLKNPDTRYLHIPILHAGTIGATLYVPTLKPGATLTITVLSFDGNKATQTVKVGKAG